MLNESRYKEGRRNQTTDVILLLDKSGSMQPRRDETVREVNKYLRQLKRDGLKYRLTVKTFNTEVETLLDDQDIQDVGSLEHTEYRPSGWTGLLDAVGSTLERSHHYSNRVLFCVVTDGEENSSRNYGLDEVRRLIDRKRSEDFQFIFLGSGPGSWQVGNRLGFNFSVATDWTDPRNSANIYKCLYTASNTMSSGGTMTANLFNTNSTSAKLTND